MRSTPGCTALTIHRVASNSYIQKMSRRIHSVLLAFALLGAIAAFGSSYGAAPAAAQSSDSANFQTPSGNINCIMYEDPDSDYASCVARNNTWRNAKKKPADCDLDWEPAEISVQSTKRGSTILNRTSVGACRGDIGPLCDPENCLTLPYGKSIRVGRITCTSQKAGITCAATEGRKRGFTIARAGYKLI
jgi:hypothetical protein